MKRGKDEEKTMGPMFPRLHVNDTEKGGPRAPPRNKMALYEQLSIPSQRFNGGGGLPNHLPPSSSTQGAAMNERGTNPAIQQSMHPTRKRDTHHSDFSNQRVHPEHKRRQEDDDFRVPVFDQQSGTSQNRSVNVNMNVNHQNRENEGITSFGGVRLANVQNARQSNRFQKENSQDFARSASNQSSRQNVKAPLKETNESSSFSHRNVSNNSSRLQSNGNLRDYDNGMWGDNEASKVGFGNASVPVREVEQEAARSPPNDPTNADAVSETSMVDSICGVDISPDDVVGIIGQKHFWKARRAIVNQQRVFAVQVFELHRLIKVQRLIAGSPHLLVEDNAFLAKPPKVSPIKKLPLEYVLKSTVNTPKHKSDIEKPNEDTEFSAENAVGKASLSSVQNDSHTPNYRPFTGNPLPPPEPNMGGSWNFNPPPGHQWLIPVMTPSEGLVYKPYPGPGFMNPLYGGCGPPGPPPGAMPMIGHNFPNYGVPPDHHYEGPPGGHPFVPPASHGYFPSYGMPPMVNPSVSSSQCEQTNTFNPHHQNSSNVPIEKKGPAVPNVVKFKAFKDSEVQASTASSRSDRTRGRNALNLFPTSPPAPPSSPPTAPAPAPQAPAPQAPAPAAAPAPARFEAAEPARVIRVVPHNARSATASVARIFRSIQEERKQYDSG